MGMMPFHLLFPVEAAEESRSVTPLDAEDLPEHSFLFVELYCVERDCHCRRVVLNILDTDSETHVATISYAFDPPRPPFDDLGQVFLDPLNPQSELSDALLDLFKEMIEVDPAYHDRLVRHYDMWKAVVNDPNHPGHAKMRAAENKASSAGSATRPPIRRAGPKVGPNDPCPCGSGRKYKRCCRG